MLKELKKQVFEANMDLVKHNLVTFTWGNVSGIDRERNLVVIKPSGVSYDSLTPEDMVVVDLISGNVVEGKYKPSSDTPTHLELYRAFKDIGGITHTHSTNATAFAQAGQPIKAWGTTHADYFYGDIPCTRELKEEEVKVDYEKNTGKVIVECYNKLGIKANDIPGVLVKNHGPFTWGKDAKQSVFHAVVLERVAEINIKTKALESNPSMSKYVLDKHYNRKHGVNAYYGQK